MVKRKGIPQHRDTPVPNKHLVIQCSVPNDEPGTSYSTERQYGDSTSSDGSVTPGGRTKPRARGGRTSIKHRSTVPLTDDTLERLKESAHFSVTVNREGADDGSDPLVGKIGNVDLVTLSGDFTTQDSIPSEGIFHLFVGDDSFLYYEWSHGDPIHDLHARHTLVEIRQPDHEFWRCFLRPSPFRLTLETVGPAGLLVLGVWLRRTALGVPNHPSQSAVQSRANRSACCVMRRLLSLPTPDYKESGRVKPDVEEFFAAIQHNRPDDRLQGGDELIEVQHPDLNPRLRPYQAEAVRWMVARERATTDSKGQLHPLYVKVTLEDGGGTIFFNRYGGTFCAEKPLRMAAVPGGILADEMGLGKTVEVLGCILCRPRSVAELNESEGKWSSAYDGHELIGDLHLFGFQPADETTGAFLCVCGEGWTEDDKTVQCGKCRLWQHVRCVEYSRHSSCNHYFCPHCWVNLDPYPSRATVVVTPSTIEKQWVDELSRHLRANALRVLVYSGVTEMGFVDPPTLADHDVVLVNYATLRRELNFVDVPHCRGGDGGGYHFRRPKRFVALPSPLTAVQWWRVCLDEAQMVEGALSRQAKMVLRLPSVNRWCVTGTPIQRSIDDLYGLLLFLGVDPYYTHQWWNTCLLQPYLHGDKDAMHKVFSKIMWRTAKRDVSVQIGIPPQTEEVHWLSFSPIEEHFYREQHVTCTNQMKLILSRISDLDVNLNRIDRHMLGNIMFPLLRLRQACCHPQVVRGQFVAIRKSTMSMEQLLDSLIKKTKTKCEDAHRIVVSSLNGVAALHIIEERWPEAVDAYREVLQSTAELRPMIKTDKLQQLHTLRNLAEVLEAGHPNIPSAMRDSDLRADAKQLQDKYLSKCLNEAMEGRAALKLVSDEVEELNTTLQSRIPWWSSMLKHLRQTGPHEEVIGKIKMDLAATANDSMSHKFQNAFGLEYVLSSQLERLEQAHEALVSAVTGLEDEPCERTVHLATACHLRPTCRSAPRCVYCLTDDLFQNYESKLFSMEDRSVGGETTVAKNEVMADDADARLTTLRRGTWADGDTERALKSLLACGRRLDVERGWCEDGAKHLRLLDASKREFRALRLAWVRLRDQASALDELAMATHRLRVRQSDEARPDPPQLDVLEPGEVVAQRVKLTDECIVAKSERQKRLGQLSYLRSLAKSDYGRRGGTNPEPCPICQHALGCHWSVLQCGHCFCVSCIRVIITEYSGSFGRSAVKCAICRQPTQHGEISYCNTETTETETDELNVLGSHSTKVEAIVRQLLRIKRDDACAKTLVFSTWTGVLEILEKALKENGLNVYAIFGKYKFQANLDQFRADPRADVLLLSVSSGAKGLNIVEATHVVLVEPSLDVGSELQAIGRVHRIGQSRPTFVHRFFVRGTIEERIHALMKERSSVTVTCGEDSDDCLTPRHLLSLFG